MLDIFIVAPALATRLIQVQQLGSADAESL